MLLTGSLFLVLLPIRSVNKRGKEEKKKRRKEEGKKKKERKGKEEKRRGGRGYLFCVVRVRSIGRCRLLLLGLLLLFLLFVFVLLEPPWRQVLLWLLLRQWFVSLHSLLRALKLNYIRLVGVGRGERKKVRKGGVRVVEEEKSRRKKKK